MDSPLLCLNTNNYQFIDIKYLNLSIIATFITYIFTENRYNFPNTIHKYRNLV